MKTATYEAEIEARVKTVANRVFVTEVPPGTPTPAYPYVIIRFGGPVRGYRDRHITSTKNDTMIAYCTMQVISETDASARDLADRIRDAVTGYIPTNCGEMACEGGMAYSNATNTNPPTKFFREVGFTFRTNLQFTP